MKFKESVILWNPPASDAPLFSGEDIRVLPLSCAGAFLPGYKYHEGGFHRWAHSYTRKEVIFHLYFKFLQLVLSGVNPLSVHAAFSEIKEYREAIPHAMPIPEHLQRIREARPEWCGPHSQGPRMPYYSTFN